jgi:hypothetical protein
MRFMIIVKGNADTEAGMMPTEELIQAMGKYHEDLINAGVLVDGSGLQPTSKGFRVRHSGGQRTVIDGPFTESKEIVAGYTIIDVGSRRDAVDWALRMPAPLGEGSDCEIEVRQFYELEDFGPSEGIDRMRENVFDKLKK